MKTWTKEEALDALRELANEAVKLKPLEAFSTEHTMWLTKCYDVLEEIFGPASRYFLTFTQFKWHETGSFIVQGFNYQAAIDTKHHEAYLRNLDTAKGLLLGAADYLEKREISDVYDARDTEPEASLILKVLYLTERQLRKVIRSQSEKESQVQDAFENLLIGSEIPYGLKLIRLNIPVRPISLIFHCERLI